MLIVGIIASIAFIAVLAFVNSEVSHYNKHDKNMAQFSMLLGVVMTVLAAAAICAFGEYFYNEPRAIDVYRGKTMLEITYKDTVPVDTVVVWK